MYPVLETVTVMLYDPFTVGVPLIFPLETDSQSAPVTVTVNPLTLAVGV